MTLKKGENYIMKLIGILLTILGAIGLIMGFMMFGDIGIAAMIGALSALLSGIGFLKADKAINANKK